ncbi:hypothetical protein BC939DRAFT_452983 [Gamsiella multidivaricata]|uniref:uncharacterized protein n=1 Tax=Gamsiella multidivaricata TaxID=101098 RepID=UPI00221ECB95|nr:uncharacterized protein BC939DRAFT_452983 [Gamsiella multidivaricata]KAG0350187.1 hypothetical protein BGZ54_003974 [Gamsiella multidivaricata]KAI7822913.1 hypothetical protein BC939DRAFT_452983 [Gamsiella multidivaricata]
MAPTHRDYCCFCIPFRLGVTIFSLLALALGGFSIWSVLRAGVTDSTAKTVAYVSTGIYGILGVSGLMSVIFKRYALAKNFSVLWWTVTVLITILSTFSMIFLATRAKDEVKSICQADLLQNENDSGAVGLATLADDVEACYKYVLLIAGVGTAVQVLVLLVGGWVASRYTGEVKCYRRGKSFTNGQTCGSVQVNPLQSFNQQPQGYPSAHPYMHADSKGEWL